MSMKRCAACRPSRKAPTSPTCGACGGTGSVYEPKVAGRAEVAWGDRIPPGTVPSNVGYQFTATQVRGRPVGTYSTSYSARDVEATTAAATALRFSSAVPAMSVDEWAAALARIDRLVQSLQPVIREVNG